MERPKQQLPVELWLVSGECFLSKQTWPCLWFLQGANSSAHSLYLVSREAIHKAHGQEQGMKLEWVFWLPNPRGRRKSREGIQAQREANLCPTFPEI